MWFRKIDQAREIGALQNSRSGDKLTGIKYVTGEPEVGKFRGDTERIEVVQCHLLRLVIALLDDEVGSGLLRGSVEFMENPAQKYRVAVQNQAALGSGQKQRLRLGHSPTKAPYRGLEDFDAVSPLELKCVVVAVEVVLDQGNGNPGIEVTNTGDATTGKFEVFAVA